MKKLNLNSIKEYFSNKSNRRKVGIIGLIVLLLAVIIIPASLGNLTPVASITVPSVTLSYENGDEGAWQFVKSAKWIAHGKARITIELDTIVKPNTDYTDVILVLDTSGSMVEEKLLQVKNDVNELINDIIPKGNKIALITFSNSSSIITDFTSDSVLLQESVNNLVAAGETNYYQALINVDTILKNYQKEATRDCVVLFLTDGLPTVDTPNEVAQYNYLKSVYSYLTINGIQYEMGEAPLTGIKNVTDNQYIASIDTLNKFLYRAATSPDSYDTFELTDYIYSDYFNISDVSSITASMGNVSLEDENGTPKVIWNLDGLSSGSDAKLTIDINLNEDLIGVGGIYPTSEREAVKYQIGSTSTTEISALTPILADNYLVSYEANAPEGCEVTNMPESKNVSVFDTVKLAETEPICTGYKFKKWQLVTEDVNQINADYFIMPEKNVTLRATWSKLTINKSMEGTVSKVQPLYRMIADSSIGLDTNVDFNSTLTASNSGVYTVDSTQNDEYPVHYYRGIINNNNLMFANKCWKIVRTTATGGVKLIYNGNINESYSLLTDITLDQYINISNDPTYPYSYDNITNQWTSTNKTNSKTGTISFSVLESGNYVLKYDVSSEENYDKAYFYKDGVELGVYSGTTSGNISLGELTSSNVIMVKYIKNSSGASGSDSVSFSISKASGTVTKNCNNTGEASQIGTSKFNSNASSPADVGYMYDTRYAYSSNRTTTSIFTVIGGMGSDYYGDSVTYENGTYTLQNATTKTWSDNYSTLTGYYTCRNSATTCSTVYYVAGAESNYQYTVKLTNGSTIDEQKIILSKTKTNNEDGTYTLTEPVEVLKKDWYTNYSTYNNYYICSDLTSTICSPMAYITSTSNDYLDHSNTIGYIYGNDVLWDGTKYTLVDTFKSDEGWSKDYKTLATKYHYTCLNTTGECTSVYYIHYFGSSSVIYYLTLQDGKNIEDAKDEMFTHDENSTSSTIKQTIDNWYLANMTAYTERLEDTIWCNDRTLYDGSLVGKDVNAGTGGSYLLSHLLRKSIRVL